MRGKSWTLEEVNLIKELGPTKSCEEIAKILGRTTRSVQHKFGQLGIEKENLKVGDIVKTWEITEIYEQKEERQTRTMAKIKSIIDGKERTIRLTALKQGKVVDQLNDGRGGKNKTHNMSGSSLYIKFNSMHDRCYNEKNQSYKNYGGRGIKVCKEWHTFENYMEWCIENGWYEGNELQLDRIDNNGDYTPENCRFATVKKNNNNRSNNVILRAFGESKTMMEWSEDDRCTCGYSALNLRILKGWGHERAITQPLRTPTDVTAFGETKTLKEWSEDSRCVCSYVTLISRIVNYEWDAEDAITRKVAGCKK